MPDNAEANPDPQKTYSEACAAAYNNKVNQIVDSLRRAVDRFELAARPRPADGHKPIGGEIGRYTQAAENALHELSWALTNANPHYLIGTAGRADCAEADAKADP